MTNESIVAVYESAEHAARAVEALEAAGVPSSAISQHTLSGISDTTTTAPVHEKGFWASLFGGEPEYEHDTAVYNRSLESGSTVVTVKAPEEHLNQVMDILERHFPIDIDERVSSYGLSAAGTTASAAPAVSSIPSRQDTSLPHGNEAVRDASLPHGNEAVRDTGLPHGNEEVIQLSEEQLNVGKRLVNRGTTRVRRFVVETPVEEAVSLHSERVSVERRPVEAGTKVIDPDFTDRTVEVTETEEEAVVGKTARVKEEVVVNKAVADRVETVRDTVRHEDVEVTRDGHETDATVSRPTTERSGV
jgi:uncharacterized protein (TIGR02271 family)